jgi:hypothetical protein
MSDEAHLLNSRDQETAPLHLQHATTTHISVNNADFVIVFGQILPFFGHEGLVGRFTLEPVSAISLSPMTAKQLLKMLASAVSNFEAQTGVLIPELGTFENVPASEE